MRVVLVSREHPLGEPRGGIGTYTATASRALARAGHEVTVVTRGEAADLREDGVRVLRLDHRSLPHRLPERLLAARRTAHVVAALRPDVVQAAEWEAEAWWLARRSAIPVVTRLATPTYLVERLNGVGPDPRADLLRRLEADQARSSAAIVAPSQAIADRVGGDWGLQPGRITVIRNPVETDAVRAAGARPAPVALPERFVLFTGRLERRKGVHVLAEALPAVLRAHPDLHVVMLGDDAGAAGGDVRTRLLERTAFAAGRMHLLGRLPQEDALAVVARAQLVVLPSLWEAFGFVAAEALALGRPVIATSGSGLAEVVQEGDGGWLVPPGDARALEAALLRRLGDPEGLVIAGERARRRAESFAPGAVADELVALYEQVVAESQGISASIYGGGYRRYFRPEDRRDPFNRLYEAKRRAVLARFAAEPPLSVLDAGGGPGRLAAPLAGRHDVTLCDISAEMLEEAGRRCPPSVRLVQADARKLPFDDASFDAVLALDLLVHLPDLDAGVRELARVVRPGGRVIFDTTNAVPWWVLAYPGYVDWRPRRLLRTLRGGGVLPEWAPTVRHQRADEVRAAIAAAGLGLEDREDLGPAWTPKWQLWIARRAEA